MASAFRVISSEIPAVLTACARSLAAGLSVLRNASARVSAASPASCWYLGTPRKGLIASAALLSGTDASADNRSFFSSSRVALFIAASATFTRAAAGSLSEDFTSRATAWMASTLWTWLAFGSEAITSRDWVIGLKYIL